MGFTVNLGRNFHSTLTLLALVGLAFLAGLGVLVVAGGDTVR